MKRSSGVLLPVASLPSKYGIGCFDRCAYDFVDQLVKAGQSYWQILPMGPAMEIRHIRHFPLSPEIRILFHRMTL